MSIMKNKCYECRNYLGCGYDAETQACHNFMPKGKTTVFDRLISSPEVLAESSVYFEEEHTLVLEGSDCGVTLPGGWTSPFIEHKYGTKSEAIAATVARLKEVEK